VDTTERRIRGIGEVSIRVGDLDAMSKFYEDVVGLEVLRRDESLVFFEIAEGYGGHSQNLALFGAGDLDSERTTLHHIALNISLDDYDREKRRLEGLGLEVQATEHAWLHVRSLYFADPEGNTLELVCYDQSVR
jgi:catechol-2,3-dioxygenase